MEPNRIAPSRFGLVHGRIGPLEKLVLRTFRAKKNQNADAGGTAMLHEGIRASGMTDDQMVGCRQSSLDFFRNEACLCC